MIKDPCQKFCLPGTGTVRQTAIDNEYIFPVFVRKRFHKAVNDPGRKQGGKTEPVDFWIIEKAINSIFAKSAVKHTGLSVHIYVLVRENETEKIAEDLQDGDSFQFPGITTEKEFPYLKIFDKSSNKVRNLIVSFSFLALHGILDMA